MLEILFLGWAITFVAGWILLLISKRIKVMSKARKTWIASLVMHGAAAIIAISTCIYLFIY